MKLPRYALAEVQHVWIVEPSSKTLEVFVRQGKKWLLESAHVGDAKVHAVPFDAVELELSALWG